MDIATLVALVLGVSAVGYIMVDGHILGLLKDYSALLFVLGGTTASTLMTYPWRVFKKVPGAFMLVLFPPKYIPPQRMISRLCELAETAIVRGIDALPEQVYDDDPVFLKTGVKALIEDWSEDDIYRYMDQEMISMNARHIEVQKMFESMGSYAPIYGLLGTLIGVLGLMKYLGDPMAMGNAMAKAITTFYGIFFANFVALPTAGKLETYSTQELLLKKLVMEGIVAIKQETYPHVLRKKLEMIIEQSERNTD